MVRLTIHERGSLLKDTIYSASDGIVTTFAIITGSAGAALSPHIVIILGFANLFADGISMAAGNYLGSKTENEYERARGDKTNEGPPRIHALVTFFAFVIAGFIPLMPYVFSAQSPLLFSVMLVALALFVIGAARSMITKRGFLKGGIEMLLIGGFASSVAYVIGYLIKSIT